MSTIDKATLIEQAARALADAEPDGCFERVDEWEAQPEEDRIAYADVSGPGSDYEDCDYYRTRARAALPVIAKALLAPLRELHAPLDQKLWPMDCINGDCDHDPTGKFRTEECCPPTTERVCAHCYEMGDRPDDGWESYFGESINWPCPTVRLLDAIEAEVSP